LRPSVIVSTGFACALNEALVGDVLIGTEVVGGFSPIPQQPLPCAEACTRLAVQAVAQAGLPSWSGRFASVPRVLCEAREKQAVADASGAIGVDMESAALAMVAREAGISFAIIRTVSDRKNEELPLDFNLFLRPTGWMAGGLACLSHPSSISGLSRLRRQSRIAAERLTAFYASYVPLLSADRTIA
jgi:adenosylhomocysteine nucleosidase